MLICPQAEPIHESECSIIDSNLVVLVEKALVWRCGCVIHHFLVSKLMTEISLLDCMLNCKLIVNVIEGSHKFILHLLIFLLKQLLLFALIHI